MEEISLTEPKLNVLDNNAGIYNVNKTLIKYLDFYGNCIKNSDYLASFTGSIVNEQNFFIEKYNLSTIHSRALEPFYIVNENENELLTFKINNIIYLNN